MHKNLSGAPQVASRTVPAFSPIVDPITIYDEVLPEPIYIAAGTLLIGQEQTPSSVGLIRSGIVKLIFSDDEGAEVILGLRSEGWWMNANLALLNAPSICSVHAVTQCSISMVSVEAFSEKLFSNSTLLKHYLFTQCRELLMLQQYTILRGRSASERLRYLLDENTGSVWATVDPTRVLRQSDIAELLGITPEHLSRVRGREPR